jgi:hypothetical protein
MEIPALERIIATNLPVANMFERNSVTMKELENFVKERLEGWDCWKWIRRI